MPKSSLNDPEWDDLFEQAGQKYNVDPRLLKAMMYTETGPTTDVVARLNSLSPKGALGPMGLVPKYFKDVDAQDPKQAIPAAAKYLAEGLDKHNNDPVKALMYYHGGPDQSGWSDYTKAYPHTVAKYYQLLNGDANSSGVSNSAILTTMLDKAQQSLPEGYKAVLNSADRPGATVKGTGGVSQHAVQDAIDVQIVGPDGKPIPNKGEDTTGLYTKLAIAMHKAAPPDLQDKLAWGGNFTTGPANGPRDLMHFDFGGDRGRFGRLTQLVENFKGTMDAFDKYLQSQFPDYYKQQSSGGYTPTPPNPKTGEYVVDVPIGTSQNLAGAADAWTNDQASAIGFGTRMFQLEQASRALQGLKEADLETGKGAEALQHMRSFFLAMTPQWLKNLGITPDEVKTAKFSELNKYLTQYAQAQANAIGPKTNQGLTTTITGQPNIELNSLAIQDLLAATTGVERMNHAGVLTFQRLGQDPNQYLNWKTQWATNVDPRAYMLDKIDEKRIPEILNNIPEAQRKSFYDQVQSAEDLGLVVPRKPRK